MWMIFYRHQNRTRVCGVDSECVELLGTKWIEFLHRKHKWARNRSPTQDMNFLLDNESRKEGVSLFHSTANHGKGTEDLPRDDRLVQTMDL